MRGGGAGSVESPRPEKRRTRLPKQSGAVERLRQLSPGSSERDPRTRLGGCTFVALPQRSYILCTCFSRQRTNPAHTKPFRLAHIVPQNALRNTLAAQLH